MTIDSRRRPPAFQEYPTDMLADERFKLMSLAERGLHWSMRLQCWVNESIPSDPTNLGRLFQQSSDEVAAAMTPRVLSYYTPSESGPARLRSVELENYRIEQRARSKKRSESGKKGAKARWGDAMAKPSANNIATEKKRAGQKGRGEEPNRTSRSFVATNDDVAGYEKAFGEEASR